MRRLNAVRLSAAMEISVRPWRTTRSPRCQTRVDSLSAVPGSLGSLKRFPPTASGEQERARRRRPVARRPSRIAGLLLFGAVRPRRSAAPWFSVPARAWSQRSAGRTLGRGAATGARRTGAGYGAPADRALGVSCHGPVLARSRCCPRGSRAGWDLSRMCSALAPRTSLSLAGRRRRADAERRPRRRERGDGVVCRGRDLDSRSSRKARRGRGAGGEPALHRLPDLHRRHPTSSSVPPAASSSRASAGSAARAASGSTGSASASSSQGPRPSSGA